jgi:uncharacterized membrane protein YadS
VVLVVLVVVLVVEDVVVEDVVVELEVESSVVAGVSTSVPGGAAMTASTPVVGSSAHETNATAIIPITSTVR